MAAAARGATEGGSGAGAVAPRELTEMEERVMRLASSETDYLMQFWSEKFQSFQIVPRGALERPSLMSTCEVLQTILVNKEAWRGLVSWEKSDTVPVSMKGTIEAILAAPWSSDAFRMPMLVDTLARTRSIDKDDPKYVDAVNTVLEQRSQVSLNRKQNTSSSLRHKNAKALITLLSMDMVPTDPSVRPKIIYALDRAEIVAFDEMTRQLAYYYSEDRSNFDVVTLTHSLMTYYECTESLYVTTSSRLAPTNMELVRTALRVIMSEQNLDGTFKKGEPITVSMTRYERDIGNSYVFFIEMLRILMRLPTEELIPYIPNFERALRYAENNIVKERFPDGEGYFSGWKSNYVQGSAACWSTAAVFRFLDRFRQLLRTVIANGVLDEFNGLTKEEVLIETGGRTSWAKLMDADVKVGDEVSSMKTELFGRMLLPQLQMEASIGGDMLDPRTAVKMGGGSPAEVMPAALYELVRDAPASPALYSCILFGPPGTAKTTIVKNMASTIGWNFVTIDTADFMADGLTQIAGRMTYLFGRLKDLEKTVILFDEIEEFCLDRENPRCTMESRLLTTAMLTQLANLRREQKNIFVVATNRLSAFDAAVIRPGRFDMLVFVGTPNKDGRKERLAEKLAKASVPAEDVEKVVSVMAKIWDEGWDELRFSTYAENEALMNRVLTLLKDGQFGEENLRKEIQAIQRTATIRGVIKDDYIESEAMSRF